MKRSPPVGNSWTDSLEGTVGVATHHDGMSGTERQSVTNDYEMRISESSFEVEAGISVSLGKLLSVPPYSIEHCNCNVGANCLNMSLCAASTSKSAFTLIAWNPLAHDVPNQVMTADCLPRAEPERAAAGDPLLIAFWPPNHVSIARSCGCR